MFTMSSSTDQNEMTMEEILTSIRKYVGEGQQKNHDVVVNTDPIPSSVKSNLSSRETKVFQLTDDLEIDQTTFFEQANPLPAALPPTEVSPTKQNSKTPSPFSDLTEAMRHPKSFTDTMPKPSKAEHQEKIPNYDHSLSEFLTHISRPIIEQWCQTNLKLIVTDLVQKEIDKMREDG